MCLVNGLAAGSLMKRVGKSPNWKSFVTVAVSAPPTPEYCLTKFVPRQACGLRGAIQSFRPNSLNNQQYIQD